MISKCCIHFFSIGFMTVFVISVCNTASWVENQSDGTDFYKLCPYNSYCKTNASKMLTDENQIPCCWPCSCENDCWKRGNCCPDYTEGVTKAPTQSCKATLIKRNIYRIPSDLNGFNSGVKRYFVVDTCPEDEENKTMSEICNGTLQNTLDDVIWVSDPISNTIYNNRFCAACHGVMDYIEWDLLTTCMEFLQPDMFTQEIEDFPDKCTLSLRPSSNLKASEFECLIPDIARCNASGLWQHYDKAIEEYCSSHTQPYLEETYTSVIIFKNIYCYICNKGLASIPSDVCSDFDDRFGKSGLNSFISVLDYHAIRTTSSSVQPGECRSDEIPDLLKPGCLKLTCPFLRLPLYGQCRRLVTRTEFLGISATYLLIPNWKTSIYGENATFEDSLKQFGKVVEHEMYKLLGLSCDGCKNNILRIPTEKNQSVLASYIKIKIELYTNDKCQDEQIVNAMSAVAGKRIRVTFGATEYIIFNVQAGSTSTNMGQEKILVFGNTTPFCPVRKFPDLGEFISCPVVTLGNKHYVALMKRTVNESEKELVKSLFDITSINNTYANFSLMDGMNISASICFRDYTAVINVLSNAAPARLRMNYLLLLGLVSLLLCKALVKGAVVDI